MSSVLIGTFKCDIFCTLPVSGMCCSPVCTQLHSRVALDGRRCKWSDRGLSGADTIHGTNHLLLSSAALEQKKKNKERMKRWVIRRVCVFVRVGVGFAVWMQNAAIIVHLMAVLKRSLIRRKWSSWFCFVVNWWTTFVLPAGINYSEGRKATLKLKFTCALTYTPHTYLAHKEWKRNTFSKDGVLVFSFVFVFLQKWERTSTRIYPWGWNALLKTITNMWSHYTSQRCNRRRGTANMRAKGAKPEKVICTTAQEGHISSAQK